jgi:PAS domain S-box-containing protein
MRRERFEEKQRQADGAERALHESEERLRQAVRVSHIGIFDHDHRTDHLYISPELRVIQGWGPDEPVTVNSYIERVHVDDREKIREAVRRSHDRRATDCSMWSTVSFFPMARYVGRAHDRRLSSKVRAQPAARCGQSAP